MMASVAYTVAGPERSFAEAPTHVLLDVLVELADMREHFAAVGRGREFRRAEFLTRMVRAELRSRN